MRAGNGPLPEGARIDAENEMDFPPLWTVIDRALPDNVAVTSSASGFGPSSWRWKISLISSRRQAHSS